MVQKRLVFLNIVIFTGVLLSLFYVLSSNTIMQRRDEFIEFRETREESTIDDYELWLVSAEETEYDMKNFSSDKSYPLEIVNGSAQQLKIAENRTTFADLRKYLCNQEPKSRKRTFEKSTVKDPCPKEHIVTYIAGGRTANQMWKYAALWALAQVTGLTPYTPGCVKYGVGALFEKLSIPNMDKIAHCPIDFKNTADSLAKWKGNQSMIINRFQFNRDIVMPYLHRIVKEEFVFKKELRLNAQKVLREASSNVSNSDLITFVGVHVRRTDYIKYLKKVHQTPLSNSHYYHKAMTFYRKKYKMCLFVVISDDPQWCHDEFGTMKDVFVASYHRNNTAGQDLAILAACNHTIIDYGTYGEWGAILAGGENIYTLKSFKEIPTAQLKGWKYMN